MARARIEVKIADGYAKFDVDEVAGIGPERVSRRGGATVAQLDQSLDEALASARPAAEAVINAFRALQPDAVEIEFGLRIDAQAGAVFARAGIAAHFTVKLKWTPANELGAPT